MNYIALWFDGRANIPNIWQQFGKYFLDESISERMKKQLSDMII